MEGFFIFAALAAVFGGGLSWINGGILFVAFELLYIVYWDYKKSRNRPFSQHSIVKTSRAGIPSAFICLGRMCQKMVLHPTKPFMAVVFSNRVELYLIKPVILDFQRIATIAAIRIIDIAFHPSSMFLLIACENTEIRYIMFSKCWRFLKFWGEPEYFHNLPLKSVFTENSTEFIRSLAFNGNLLTIVYYGSIVRQFILKYTILLSIIPQNKNMEIVLHGLHNFIGAPTSGTFVFLNSRPNISVPTGIKIMRIAQSGILECVSSLEKPLFPEIVSLNTANKLAVLTDSRTICVFDLNVYGLENPSYLRVNTSNLIVNISLHPTKSIIVVVFDNGTIEVWNTMTHQIMANLSMDNLEDYESNNSRIYIRAVQFDHTGHILYVSFMCGQAIQYYGRAFDLSGLI